MAHQPLDPQPGSAFANGYGDAGRRPPRSADLDALLRKQMAVVPSTAFLPRVRERVAGEHIASSSSSWRLLFPAGALAAASALAISLSGLADRVSVPTPPPRPILHTMTRMAPATALPAGTPVARVPVRLPVSGPKAAIEDPPVIVDVRQRAALGTLLWMVQQGRLTDEAFEKTVRPSLEPIRNGVVPIGVNALEVSPIEAGGVLQFGTEK